MKNRRDLHLPFTNAFVSSCSAFPGGAQTGVMDLLVDLPLHLWRHILDCFVGDLLSLCHLDVAFGKKYEGFYREVLHNHVLLNDSNSCGEAVSRNINRHSVSINIPFILWCHKRRTSMRCLFVALQALPHFLTISPTFSFPLVRTLTLSSSVIYMGALTKKAKGVKVPTKKIDQASLDTFMTWFPNLSAIVLDIGTSDIMVTCVKPAYSIKLEARKTHRMIFKALNRVPSVLREISFTSALSSMSDVDYISNMKSLTISSNLTFLDLQVFKVTDRILDFVSAHVATRFSGIRVLHLLLHKALVTPERVVQLVEAFHAQESGLEELCITRYDWSFSLDSPMLLQMLPALPGLRSLTIDAFNTPVALVLADICAFCPAIEVLNIDDEFRLRKSPNDSLCGGGAGGGGGDWTVMVSTSSAGKILDLHMAIAQHGGSVIPLCDVTMHVCAVMLEVYHPRGSTAFTPMELTNESVLHLAPAGRSWQAVLLVVGRHIASMHVGLCPGYYFPRPQEEESQAYNIGAFIDDVAVHCNATLRSFTIGFYSGPSTDNLRKLGRYCPNLQALVLKDTGARRPVVPWGSVPSASSPLLPLPTSVTGPVAASFEALEPVEGWREFFQGCARIEWLSFQNLASPALLRTIANECPRSFPRLTIHDISGQPHLSPETVFEHIRTRQLRGHDSFVVEFLSPLEESDKILDGLVDKEDRARIARALRFSVSARNMRV